jgi:hypothetical protein
MYDTKRSLVLYILVHVKGMHTGFWWESQKERDHKENLGVCGRKTLG